MAGNSGTYIKVAAAAGVAWYAYSKGWLSMLGIGTPSVGAASPAPAAPAAPDPNRIIGGNTLDAIYPRMVALAKAPAAGLSVDNWNVALMAAQPSITAPDPMPIFQAAVPGFDRGQLMSAAQYWAVMAPALRTKLGLSGLGFYGMACGQACSSSWPFSRTETSVCWPWGNE